MATLSPRLRAMVDALPLRPGCRVLEIGCGPGAAAREVASRVGDGFVLGIDRSEAAISACAPGPGLEFRQVAIEDFEMGELEPFDVVFAVRVGALDGRHEGEAAMARIRACLAPGGRLFVDGVERSAR